ncbi:MAG: SpoIIE family protein phosphatase, partial [Campylobacterota bacterium]|nr:SpoIIE family protein phosphatase [Campylobacterota bacterium]
LALLVVAASGVISILFFRNLLTPITNLSNIALKVTSGDYSQRCVAQSNDEVGTLSREFNKMIDTIKENIEKLDLKVEQRTKELVEQKRVFEKLFYDTSDGILLISNNHFIDCNDAVVKMLKYQSKEELLLTHPSDLSPEYQPDGKKSFETANELMQICMDKGLHHFEWRHKRANGEEFWAEIVLTKLHINNEDIIHVVWRDIEDRKKLEAEIQNKSKELESIYRSLQDSIEYASEIQNAIVPHENLFDLYFDEHFIFWEQKDTVGGDIYLFEKLRNRDEALLMVIDCTGHGVPGAFVTMLVKAIEREIVTKVNKSDYEVSPAVILGYFNQTMKKLLKQESIESISNAGFDGSVVYINKKEKILKYAGAQSPFIYIQDDIIEMIKGDHCSIGYKKSNSEYQFKEYTIKLDRPLYGYLVTDGYFDQTGGKKGFLLGKKRFLKLIEENYRKPFLQQKEEFIDRLKRYQGDHIRKDDITLIGFKI